MKTTKSTITTGSIITGIRCTKSHSGNNFIALGARGFGECQGCGESYSPSEIANPESSNTPTGLRGVAQK